HARGAPRRARAAPARPQLPARAAPARPALPELAAPARPQPGSAAVNQIPPEDRRSPLTPQLALRVAILGSFALALFAIIFFRLWYLQVLSGQAYAKQATGNYVRSIDVPAPRGQILDRSNNVLVDSKRAIAVEISPPDLPVPLQLCSQ